MTTKCTEYLISWYIVAAYIDNTLNTTRNNRKLVYLKISKSKFIDRKYNRQLLELN
jgi:hypothetical protein